MRKDEWIRMFRRSWTSVRAQARQSDRFDGHHRTRESPYKTMVWRPNQMTTQVPQLSSHHEPCWFGVRAHCSPA